MKLNSITLLALFFINVTAVDAAVTLTNFGTTTSQSFQLLDSTFSTTTQTTVAINISGSDLGSLFNGSFATTSIAGDSNVLTLQGSVSASPSSAFTITLYDSNSLAAIYSGGSWTALSSGTTSLNLSSTASGFNFNEIVGMELATSGAPPGSTVTASLTGLTAGVIPEPTRALLLGVGLMGMMFRRRRC